VKATSERGHGQAPVDIQGTVPYCHYVAVGPSGTPKIRVAGLYRGDRYELLYFETEEFLVPQWWLGVSDADGTLVQTAVLSGASHSSSEVLDWLRSIASNDVAEALVKSAVAPSAEIRPRLVRSGRPMGPKEVPGCRGRQGLAGSVAPGRHYPA
jgi:hypothetical protein